MLLLRTGPVRPSGKIGDGFNWFSGVLTGGKGEAGMEVGAVEWESLPQYDESVSEHLRWTFKLGSRFPVVGALGQNFDINQASYQLAVW